MTKIHCYKCGQPLAKHDDNMCQVVLEIWGEPAAPVKHKKPWKWTNREVA